MFWCKFFPFYKQKGNDVIWEVKSSSFSLWRPSLLSSSFLAFFDQIEGGPFCRFLTTNHHVIWNDIQLSMMYRLCWPKWKFTDWQNLIVRKGGPTKLKEKYFLGLGWVGNLEGSEIEFDKGGRRRCAPFKVRDWAASSRESDRYLMQRPLHFRHSIDSASSSSIQNRRTLAK
jgi:hypothetical protein